MKETKAEGWPGTEGRKDGYRLETAESLVDRSCVELVRRTVARLNQIVEVTQEERDASVARMDAAARRFHVFMGVASADGH